VFQRKIGQRWLLDAIDGNEVMKERPILRVYQMTWKRRWPKPMRDWHLLLEIESRTQQVYLGLGRKLVPTMKTVPPFIPLGSPLVTL